MSKFSEEQWELLKKLTPSESERDRMRMHLRSSIRNSKAQKKKQRIFDLKNVVLTSLFLLLSAGLLFQVQKYDQREDRAGHSQAVKKFILTWDLDTVYSERSQEGYDFYKKGESEKVGFAEFVNDGKKKEILSSKAMNVEDELQNFPYPTKLYIEHVKMMDVSLRYHFFVEAGNETLYLSFDYPKLEYADIFQIIGSLRLKNPAPYHHEKPLYVTHGYGNLPYPVGLQPAEINGDTEKYIWDRGTDRNMKDYLAKIQATDVWKQTGGEGSSFIFESADGMVIVKITRDVKELTYQYTYPGREE
ncbi:hypothetical protein J7E38_18905 [Bacillus sp. ISL-35]|uniref:hypothetical protein n=1 Tax=Bacillus sp. ISL-35 TaxID=2819122 RepID=UPI001BE7D115|nr:hypothetical protein [Bacillus sp. ISL-35]MBT2681064.1 hypothetical protein [Bacillus sp. ISL-35]MBT2705384.1 hypothetical protein [Chryseobacterium sp. ISL-80]